MSTHTAIASRLATRLGRAARAAAGALLPAGAALLATLLPEPARLGLRYQRQAVLDGELWRLLTAHLVHTGVQHLLLNLATLALLVVLAPPGYWARWRRRSMELAAVALLLSLGLLATHPELDWYLGLSGVLHGLLALVALAQLPRRPGLAALLALGLAAKLAAEQIWGAPAHTSALVGAPVIVDAHLLGALAGLLVAGGTRALHRLRPAPPDSPSPPGR